MNTLMSALSIVLFATSLVAQDVPIPPDLPLQRPTKRLDNDGLLNRLRATNRPTFATEGRVNAGPVEARIAALEAKVEALQSELEAQKALIKQLQELLDRQQKKN